MEDGEPADAALAHQTAVDETAPLPLGTETIPRLYLWGRLADL
jgi:hypothetical protein